MKKISKGIIIFLLILISINSYAARVRCSQCNKIIKGKYQILNKKPFCSKKCLSSVLPKCSVCKKTYNGGYVSNGINYCGTECLESTLPKCVVCNTPCKGGYTSKNKRYCSKECLSTSWKKCKRCLKPSSKGFTIGKDETQFYCESCGKLPRCFSCSKPDNGYLFDDGRNICQECYKTSIMKISEAQFIFNEVRRRMKYPLKIYTNHKIKLRLVPKESFEKTETYSSGGLELGLYKYNKSYEKITETKTSLFGKKEVKTRIENEKETYEILVLYGIPKNRFREVVAHELAHDWMKEHFPKIEKLWIKEGWAEYVAKLINIQYNQPELNRRMEFNPDPIYGEGYRKINKIVKEKGNAGLMKFFNQNNNGNIIEAEEY